MQTELGQDFAEQNNAEIFSETSAKSGYNVEMAFLALAKALVERSDKIQQSLEEEYYE
ncbi:MAG: hypothetical protein ACFFD2_19880 [Promethearchaeota archaeon]